MRVKGKEYIKSMSEFKIRIARETPLPEEGSGIMTIVIFRPYTHLEKELRNAFKGQKDFKVTLDKRNGERRKQQKAVERERRRVDRRIPKHEIVEVAISASTKRPRSNSRDDSP
jgi:hypothetical protein